MKQPILLAACAGLFLAGCVTTHFEAPRLSIISVNMTNADLFSQQFRLRLHVDNPNRIALPIKGIDYQVLLQGEPFADGASTQSFVVPAMGQAEFDTLVTTNLLGTLGPLLSKSEGRDQLQYTLTGNVQLDKGWLRTMPFKEQGIVPLNLKK